MEKKPIVVEVNVNAPIDKVWEYWNTPKHIESWAFASDDWEATGAENDLKTGGKFKTTMSAKDKSESFDFEGVYTLLENKRVIEYDMSDGRHVKTEFNQTPEGVKVVQSFDPESENTEELQRQGWQAILNNFKKYVENS